ncbi:MAG: F0F1 ATP synthase subunit delta [Candidatus Omnitrophica bacterium]|nr:F0F1 ATP synthase subunit delta [Candidatus Omnitrophota bacterium]
MYRRIMSKYVVNATRHLEEMSEDYQRKQEEIERQLLEAEEKAKNIITEATKNAENIKSQIIKEAEEEKNKIILQARQKADDIINQAEQSRQLLLAEIEDRISKEAVNKACELIQNTLPEQFRQDIHLSWVEELISSGFWDLKNLHIPEKIDEIKIVTPFKLTETIRNKLVKKMKEIINMDFAIKEEIDETVVLGIIINFGNLVIDGSLKNKILKAAKNISKKI